MGHEDDRSKESSVMGHSRSHATHHTDKHQEHGHGGHGHHE